MSITFLRLHGPYAICRIWKKEHNRLRIEKKDKQRSCWHVTIPERVKHVIAINEKHLYTIANRVPWGILREKEKKTGKERV